MLMNRFVRFEKIYKLAPDSIFMKVICFHLFIKNIFIKNKKLIFPTKYTKYRNRKKLCLIKNDLQIFFNREIILHILIVN